MINNNVTTFIYRRLCVSHIYTQVKYHPTFGLFYIILIINTTPI